MARALALTLLGRADADLAAVPPGSVLVADEVSARDFMKVPAGALAGIVCTQGAATSHLAIMARTQGRAGRAGLAGGRGRPPHGAPGRARRRTLAPCGSTPTRP